MCHTVHIHIAIWRKIINEKVFICFFNYTVGGYSFTTKRTKSGHLSLYDVTDGKVCIATRIYDDYGAIEDSIYVYLYKKLGITK